MLIGVTGRIGSGKTTAARILADLGAVVIDADKIGHAVVEQSTALKARLADRFGDDIFTGSGKLNRKRLAARAFADQKAKRALDRLVHPYLLKELRRQIKAQTRKSPVVVVDAALLLDWKMDREMDLTLVIHASWETRLRRLRARGISVADARARQKAQLPFAVYRERSDRLILNNKSVRVLGVKLAVFYEKFVRKPMTNG